MVVGSHHPPCTHPSSSVPFSNSLWQTQTAMEWLNATFGESKPRPRLSIALGQSEYKAGDLLSGVVTLQVSERITNAERLRLELVGKETMTWEEVREKLVDARDEEVGGDTGEFDGDTGQSDGLDAEFDGDTGQNVEGAASQRQHKRKVLYTVEKKQAYVIIETEICLDVPARPYDPGSYQFPFEFRLPERGLVPTFSLSCGPIGLRRSTSVAASYELTATLPRRGFLVSSIRHTVHPVVREEPSPPPVPRAITLTKQVPVYFCVFFNKGSCDFSATLHEDVVRIGDQATIEVIVENNSSRWVDSVRTRLIQHITLNHINMRFGKTDSRSTCQQIASGSFTGVPPDSRQLLTIAQPIQHDGNWSSEMVPTIRSHFLTVSYELGVSCKQSWCWESPTIKFPIVVATAGQTASILVE